jgi:histidine triad (HIT) family protein
VNGPTCPFCARIADGEVEQTLHPDVVTFEPLRPVTPGHRLFLPTRHLPRATDNPKRVGETMEQAAVWAVANGVDSSNLIVSTGRAATQTIPHFHVHLVPRRPLDGLHLPWTGQP